MDEYSAPVRLRVCFTTSSAQVQSVETTLTQLVKDKARRHQVDLETSHSVRVTMISGHSPNLTIRMISSLDGMYVNILEQSLASTLRSQVETSVYVYSSSSLDFQFRVLRGGGEAIPSMPMLLSLLANNPNIQILDRKQRGEVAAVPFSETLRDRYLLTALNDADRTSSIIAFARPVKISQTELASLARRVCGFASVIVVDIPDTLKAIQDLLGAEWSIPDGGARVYGPGLNFRDDPLRYGMVMTAESLMADSAVDDPTARRGRFDELLWSACRQASLRDPDVTLPSVDEALRIFKLAEVEPLPSKLIEMQASAANIDVATLQEAHAVEVGDLTNKLKEVRASLLAVTEEKAFEEEVSRAWRATAERVTRQLNELEASAGISLELARMAPCWRELIESLVLEAVEASESLITLGDLKDTLAVVSTQYRRLELRAVVRSESSAVATPPQKNDPASLAIYLSERYPGVFSLNGQGARSYKAVPAYDEQDRFLEALDILGREYYAWKVATSGDVLTCRDAFEERCRSLRFKSSPSATPQGFNYYPEDHSIRLNDGQRVPMFELRDHGTTMESRHMLYIGFVWDEKSGQIILGRFDHPSTLSMHT